ncbi:MAG: hypothetical protein LUG95_07375 [Clostridiales bacterium]|nr:hypothetical protein [Clostridiales bacterium]
MYAQLENRLICYIKALFPKLVNGILNRDFSQLTEILHRVDKNREFFLTLFECRPSEKTETEVKVICLELLNKAFQLKIMGFFTQTKNDA